MMPARIVSWNRTNEVNQSGSMTHFKSYFYNTFEHVLTRFFWGPSQKFFQYTSI